MTTAASTHHTPHFDGRWLVEVLALAALYFLTARLGLLMTISGGHVTPVWPPSGIALAAVLLRGRRMWPGIWLGSFVANSWDFYGATSPAAGIATSATFGIGASLAALLGRQLLRWFVSERNPLERVRDVCAFMALGGVVSCLVSATIGVTTLCLAGFAPWSGYGQNWLTWWLGDTGGVFIVAPLFLVWGGTGRRESAARWVELFGGFGLLIAATYYVFIENTVEPFAGKPLVFPLVPFLVWAAVRFGQRGAAMASGLIALLAVWGAIQGSGPFNLASRDESLVDLELFLGVISFTALSIAGMVAARRRVLDELESRVAERTASLDQANAALRESEARFVAFMDHLPGFAWMKDLEGRYTYVNDMLSQLGPDRAPWLGKTDADLWPPELAATYRANDEAVIATGKPLQTAESYLRDGEVSYLLVSKFPILDATGAVVMVGGAGMDITDRKRAEEALNAQALRYKTLMETSTDSIYVLNEKGDLQEANATFLRRRGYTAAEVKGFNVADWDARWTREQLQVRLRELADGGAVFETRHRCKDGAIFDVEVCATRVRIGGEQLFFCVTRDITERKLAEQALHAAHERLGTIIQKAPLAIIAIDSTAIVQMWNPAAERLFGWTEAELVGRPIVPLIPQEDRRQFEKLLAGEIRDGLELRRLRKDGSLVDVSVWTAPLRNAQNEIVGTIGMFADITERRRAEEAQRESRLRYETLVQSIDGIVWEADPKTLNLTFVSKQAERILGYPLERWFEEPNFWPDHIHPDDRDWALKFCVDARVRGEDHQFEYRMISADGRVVWLNDIVTLHLGPDQSVTLRGLMVDITERKQAEAALAVRARQQAVIGELGKLALAGGELQSLFDQTVAGVAETLGVEYCKVLELLPDGSAMRLVAGVGWKEGLVGRATVALGPDSQAGYTLRTKKLILVEDLRRETRFRGQPLLHEHGVVSGLSVVIGEVEKPFGVLGAHTTRQRTFTADDMHFFQSVANTLAEAIQRKQAEDRLRRSEEKFKTLFRIAPVGISVLDRQHNVIDANPALEQITRLRREELLSAPHPHRTILNTDGTPKLPHEFSSERAMAENRPIHDAEAGIVLDNGEIVWVLVSVAPVALPEASAVVITQDITERKRTEQALRESEERFRELAENINEVFWVWTATPGNARCLYVSPAYAAIWGHSCESLYSSPQSWMEALHPQDRERIMEEGARMDFEKISDWTYRIVRPDQSVRWIRDRIFPVRDVRGAVVRFAGIAQDITESREAEEQVRKANRQLRTLSRRRIQEQEDERRRLSRELHDQIGQSLTAAKINVEVLRATEHPALVGRMDETIAILDQLLGQVRQISLDLRPPMLDDLGLVPALRSLVDEQGRRASVAVRFSADQIPEKLDPEIQITCFRIAQEAITNAVRHAKATHLDIALRCTHGKELRLLARDDGIGFDARTKQAQAVDLGLIGIKERAALVGGRAKIISSPRQGTTVDVSLPLKFRGERQARHM